MFRLKLIIFLLFFPASLGLLWQSFTMNILSAQLISFTFFLFTLEQAKMTVIDLKSYYYAKKSHNNDQVSKFLWVIITTIIIELSGFYLALFYLGWGGILVLISLIWFNLLAPLKVIEFENFKVKDYCFSEKIPLLAADFFVLLLMCLWLINFYPLIIAFILLLITLTFTGIKYIPNLNHLRH